jgi:hypothetical protein
VLSCNEWGQTCPKYTVYYLDSCGPCRTVYEPTELVLWSSPVSVTGTTWRHKASCLLPHALCISFNHSTTMSRRTAIVEEFDDDTDLPLPSRPLPNTGAKGPLLQEVDSEEDDLETGNEPTAGPATSSQFHPRPPPQVQHEAQSQSINELNPDQKLCV